MRLGFVIELWKHGALVGDLRFGMPMSAQIFWIVCGSRRQRTSVRVEDVFDIEIPCFAHAATVWSHECRFDNAFQGMKLACRARVFVPIAGPSLHVLSTRGTVKILGRAP